MTKILNAEILAEEKVANGLTRESKVYLGKGRDAVNEKTSRLANMKVGDVETDSIPYTVTSKSWKNSAARFELLKDMKNLSEKIQNAESAPSSTDIATYFGLLHIDVQRQADELADFSASIYNVLSRPDATESTYLRDLIPYVGKEKVIIGENDAVPLIQANLANQETITLSFKAFGWKDSIKNMIFNPIDRIARVTEAAAKINVDSRNNDIIGRIVGLSFYTSGTPKHYQAADSTSGASYDELMYNTFRKALKKLAALKHPLTGQTMGALGAFLNRVKILCNPADAWAIQRVVSGDLSKANGIRMIATALPFAEIIPYGGGIMNGLVWGKETLSLPGVTQGYAYIFLPNDLGGFVLDKRTQTMEVGTGSVLELSTEERAWYRINGQYNGWFDGDLVDDASSGTGCIVKIALPSD